MAFVALEAPLLTVGIESSASRSRLVQGSSRPERNHKATGDNEHVARRGVLLGINLSVQVSCRRKRSRLFAVSGFQDTL